MNNTQHKPLVGFAGMTHLGIVSAAAAAQRGFPVVTYHPTAWAVPSGEPGLEDWYVDNPTKIACVSAAYLYRCGLVFVTLDVPLDGDGRPDLEPVKQLVETITPHLNYDAVLVIMSQVPPGFTRGINFPKERLFYQAETLIFGQSVERARNPDRVIIGCADREQSLPAAYMRFLIEGRGQPPWTFKMSYESAELTKIAINALLVASITATNMLAEVAATTGGDWAEIKPAIHSDKRFGPHAYLTPGLGIGGGHIDRDIHTILTLTPDANVARAFLADSVRRRQWCYNKLSRLRVGSRIAILGITYKPDTDSTVNSAGAWLAERFKELCDVRCHDPAVVPGGIDIVLECFKGADALVITTPWPQYRDIKIMDLQLQMRGRLILDPYRMLDADEAVLRGFEYHTLGAPPRFPA